MRAEQEKLRLAKRLAEALLINQGQIAFSEIKAIPFVENERMAGDIVDHLFRDFDVSISQRRRYDRSGSPIEDVIVLQDSQVRQTEISKGKERPVRGTTRDLWRRTH